MKPRDINLTEILENASSKTRSEWCRHFNVSSTVIDRLRKKYNLVFKKKSGKSHSEESKRKMSIKRKEWLTNNPERHPWKNKSKFKSDPCERVKEFLRNSNVSFIEEFSPEIDGRYFSIDIAIPDKMIAIEINGNQHYERSGELKPYYQERHDLLESFGWAVYEIHYSACFKEEKWNEFIVEIQKTEQKIEFDYFTYKPRNRKEFYRKDFCKCGFKKEIKAKTCFSCQDFSQFDWPDPKIIQSMIWEKPSSIVCLELGVSDVAIGKFCKRNNIPKPPRGYWMKNKYKKD